MSQEPKNPEGRPRSCPELDALEPGASWVIPWRVDARGVMLPQRFQESIARTVHRRALALGVTFHLQGTGYGLRVTRTA